MKQMEKNMPIKIILARSCIFLGLDFYASISWGARAEEICRTIWVKAKISNSGSFKSIKTIVRSCKCNLKLFKVRPSNACERKSIWARPIEGKCYQQKCFFWKWPVVKNPTFGYLKLFKVRPSNACECKHIWARPIERICWQQKLFFRKWPLGVCFQHHISSLKSIQITKSCSLIGWTTQNWIDFHKFRFLRVNENHCSLMQV